MEVLNTNRDHNGSTFGPSYHRYSNLSLVSAANSDDNYSLADQSFHTCCDGEDHQVLPPSILVMGRVTSYGCLEDVQEEDHMDMSSASQPTLPLRSHSQLQPQPLAVSNHPMTAARLALSSDFGVLKRSLDYDIAEGPAKATPVKVERDQIMSYAAIPMSRSFASPRVALNTAFRSSTSSLNSLVSARESLVDAESDKDLLPPVFLAVPARQQRSAVASSKPLKLDDMADDVQQHILSFVPLEDVRALMGTNRRYRRLLFTRDAENLWKNWCNSHNWAPSCLEGDKILVDDLSLPTAARPKSIVGDLSQLHQQANLSLLLSMAQCQPTEIDVIQLNEYVTHQHNPSRSRRRRFRNRLHTTDGSQPLLKYQVLEEEQPIVQFTGRVGQGDRCVRGNKALPRPTLIDRGQWMVAPSQLDMHDKGTSSCGLGKHHPLLDLFCRSTRAVPPARPAWRPFVAPFFSPNDSTAVHLTPRFVSYFEVSILEPTQGKDATTNDCVAVGVATEAFDWHTRMPGWDASSFGYHGDDGGIFHSSGGMLRKFGPSYGRGDVVGCGIDHVMRGIFFTLNGEFLGYGWTGLPQERLERDLYPVVGIDTNDFIHCNFGTEPFRYDLKSLVVKHEELVHQSLSLASPLVHSSRSV